MPHDQGYAEARAYLYNLQRFGIKLGLARTRRILAALGNPHLGQRYVHVAGSNGKGSVAAMIASVLQTAGLKTGLFTSPHLVDFTERFRIDGRDIAPGEVVALVEILRGVLAGEEPPTFFEATTVMALLYFARARTDVAVIEVGMGGRLDATNVITPLAAVITNIALEHQAYLGRTLRAIAGEKAGIVKGGVPVVTGAAQPPVVEVLEQACRVAAAPLVRLGRDARYRSVRGGLHYRGRLWRLPNLQVGLKGAYQARNAALAVLTLETLQAAEGLPVDEHHVRQGLARASWPGRMQEVAAAPRVILDGAHNPAGARALARSVGQQMVPCGRLILVIGILADKAIPQILRALVPLSDYVIYTQPRYIRAASAADLMRQGAVFGRGGEVCPEVSQALGRALRLARTEDLILVCGSLFTVGEALAHFRARTGEPG